MLINVLEVDDLRHKKLDPGNIFYGELSFNVRLDGAFDRLKCCS